MKKVEKKLKYDNQIRVLRDYTFHLKTKIINMKNHIGGEFTRKEDSEVRYPREIKECTVDIKTTEEVVEILEQENNATKDSFLMNKNTENLLKGMQKKIDGLEEKNKIMREYLLQTEFKKLFIGKGAK